MDNRSRLVRMRVVNFGCFDSHGIDVALDDIVCLVGANNCGKSTTLRAYEAAVNMADIKPDEINEHANGQPASVELWIHIPEGTENIASKWKEAVDGLLLVRSRWEWPAGGGRPTRSTWDPELGAYSPDGNASGLDAVFNSRLPKPFRIESLQDPAEEHKRLLELVLEPIKTKLNESIKNEESPLRATLRTLQHEAEVPVVAFQEAVERIQEKVNASYKKVFSTAEVRLTVSLGELSVDPGAALIKSSRLDVREAHGQTAWHRQGTGSQRALFWSILEVRSELNRVADEQKLREKLVKEKEKALQKLQDKCSTLKKAEAREKNTNEIRQLQEDLEGLRGATTAAHEQRPDTMLPGYMLLIDEPETALHPSAIRAAKEHLYSLASDSGWQVMLSTHHPAFVDPLKDHTTIVRLHRLDAHAAPNVYRTDEVVFTGEEKDNLKSLLAFDASVAEMFFGSRVVIVEGDTEFAAFTEVMNDDVPTFPLDQRPLIIRARGKATIPILIKMLAHFKVDFAVLHDIDSPRTATGDRWNGAYTLNATIAQTVCDARSQGVNVIHRISCPNFEQQHGMTLPNKDKPFETWKAVRSNESVKASVRSILLQLCATPTADAGAHENDGRNFEMRIKEWALANAGDNPAFCFEIEEVADVN